jgi:4-carboxymuconolactone decarboxylase
MADTPRFPALKPDDMTPAQRAIFDDMSSGPRGGVNGPFRPLLYQPDLLSHVRGLGDHLRFKLKLSMALAEIAVLVAARRWTCQFEWYRHAPFAEKEGLSASIIAAIKDGRRPAEMNEDETVVYDVCTTIQESGRLPDALFEAATARFGRDGVLELLALCGYYSMLAFVLNVADDPLPNGAPPPLT